MPSQNGENEARDAADGRLEAIEEKAKSDIEMTRLLRNIAHEAHIDRRRYFVITMSVVFAVFAFRQFVPPVWTLWF